MGLLSRLQEIVKDREFFQAAVRGDGGLVSKLSPALATPWTVAHQVPLSMGFSSPWGITKSWTWLTDWTKTIFLMSFSCSINVASFGDLYLLWIAQLLGCVPLFVTTWIAECQFPCPSPSPGVCSNRFIESLIPSDHLVLCLPTFSFWLQSFPESGSFPMSYFFTSHGQRIGASALASVLSMNIQGWFPLGLTGLISLLSKGFSRVFTNTTVQKSQFFGAQPSLVTSLMTQMVKDLPAM